jgi:DNA-binding transcriptional regulator LsrR (DeoR family)
VTITPSLPDGSVDQVRGAQAFMAHADAELRRAAQEIRDVARNMLEMGMSQQDAAIILGVSRQRVAQLLKV